MKVFLFFLLLVSFLGNNTYGIAQTIELSNYEQERIGQGSEGEVFVLKEKKSGKKQ